MTEQTMRIVIAADHRGFRMKQFLLTQHYIADYMIEWHDAGTDSHERTDYPLFARRLLDKMIVDPSMLGIAICGTGIGMSIALNRSEHIYAGLVWHPDVARLAREDDNVNVLVLPSDFIAHDVAFASVASWLTAHFKKGRYAERIEMINELF